MIVIMAVYALFVGVLYGQQHRWSAALGWILLVGGIIALSAGLGSAFPWGGLAFLFLSATGVLLLLLDLAARRAGRRSRQ
jgi:hypothetical protein